MTRTHHEKWAAKLLDELLYSPPAAQALALTRRSLREGRFDGSYVDRIGQSLRGPRSWSPEQAGAFLRIHTGLTSGEFAQILVPLGQPPNLDANREANNLTLLALHPAFRAEVNMSQEHADSDGLVWWKEAVIADRSTGERLEEGGGSRPSVQPAAVDPGGIPLEVGYTKPSRTLQHLVQRGGVARWPYHHRHLWILLSMRTEHARARSVQAGGPS